MKQFCKKLNNWYYIGIIGAGIILIILFRNEISYLRFVALFGMFLIFLSLYLLAIKISANKKEFDIKRILNGENEEKVISKIDDRLNHLSDYGNNIRVLNQSQKIVLIIENLEREINNGGFNQFYFNSSGNFANETLEYLKIIGANSTFEIVKKANDEFPNGFVPSDRGERTDILLEIEEKADPTWAECNQLFYQYTNNISALLVEFIKNNRNDFV